MNLSIDQWPNQQKQCQLSIEIENRKRQMLKEFNEELIKKQKYGKPITTTKNRHH